MRLGLVTTSYSRFDDDGNARFVRSIAEAQAALGHEVHVLAPYSSQIKPYSSPVHLHWFKYVWPARWGVMGHAAALENDRHLRGPVLWQTPLFSLSLFVQLSRLISHYHLDLIHAHWVLPSGILAALSTQFSRRRLFISLHGSDMYLAQRSKVWRSLASKAFQIACGITACSQPLADAAHEMGAPADRVHLIPWGADPRRFDTTLDPQACRRLLGLPVAGPLVLAAGRLVAKKGFVQLVRAMPRILERVPGAHLVIAGSGPEQQHLERWRAELDLSDRVLLLGNVVWNKMPMYLSACDVFVMPSVKDVSGNLDGLPTVILEAMAAGRSVVATRVAGVPLVVDDGVTGRLVDQAEPDQLGDAIAGILASESTRLAMQQAARQKVLDSLTWEHVARRFDELYRSAGE